MSSKSKQRTESETVRLEFPVQHGGEVIEELVIKRPKAKHLRGMAQGTVSEVLDLMGKLSGQPPSVIDELSLEDFEKAQEVVEGFMPPGQMAGS